MIQMLTALDRIAPKFMLNALTLLSYRAWSGGAGAGSSASRP